MKVNNLGKTKAGRIVLAVEAYSEQHGISPSKVAREAGIDPALLTRYRENPETKPTTDTIAKLVRSLKVNESWLRMGEGEMFADPWGKSLEGIDWARSDARPSAMTPEQVSRAMAELTELSRENRELRELNQQLATLTADQRERVLTLVRTLTGAPKPEPPTSVNEPTGKGKG